MPGADLSATRSPRRDPAGELEEHGIVQRVPEGIGQGVRYELTERCRGLVPALVELRKSGWVNS